MSYPKYASLITSTPLSATITIIAFDLIPVGLEECINDNECTGQWPCENDGTCTDLDPSYECACEAGFTGFHCQVDIDECADEPCLNGGMCHDWINTFNCTCADGFEGEHFVQIVHLSCLVKLSCHLDVSCYVGLEMSCNAVITHPVLERRIYI